MTNSMQQNILDESLKQLNQSKVSLIQRIAKLALRVDGNQVLPRPALADIKYAIRDSLIHRYDSPEYHLRLLFSCQVRLVTKLESDPTAFHDEELLFRSTHEQIILFDDIVFNLSSLFDYMGNFIGFIYCSNPKLKWNGAAKASQDKKHNLCRYEVSTAIVSAHREFIDDLFKYRSALYHSNAELPGYSTKLGFSDNRVEAEYSVRIPKKLRSTIKLLRNDKASSDMSILNSCIFIIRKSLEILHELTKAIEKEIDQIAEERIMNRKRKK